MYRFVSCPPQSGHRAVSHVAKVPTCCPSAGCRRSPPLETTDLLSYCFVLLTKPPEWNFVLCNPLRLTSFSRMTPLGPGECEPRPLVGRTSPAVGICGVSASGQVDRRVRVCVKVASLLREEYGSRKAGSYRGPGARWPKHQPDVVPGGCTILRSPHVDLGDSGFFILPLGDPPFSSASGGGSPRMRPFSAGTENSWEN